MTRNAIADELFDFLFTAQYNVLLQQKLGEASAHYEHCITFAIMLFGIVALVFSVAALHPKLKQFAWPWWLVNSLAIAATAFGVVFAVLLLIHNTAGTTRGHFEIAARWQDLHLDAEQLAGRFKNLTDDAPIPETVAERLAVLKTKRQLLEQLELAVPSPPRELEEKCYAIEMERRYGPGNTTQAKVDELKKSDFEKWARAQVWVDPKVRDEHTQPKS